MIPPLPQRAEPMRCTYCFHDCTQMPLPPSLQQLEEHRPRVSGEMKGHTLRVLILVSCTHWPLSHSQTLYLYGFIRREIAISITQDNVDNQWLSQSLILIARVLTLQFMLRILHHYSTPTVFQTLPGPGGERGSPVLPFVKGEREK